MKEKDVEYQGYALGCIYVDDYSGEIAGLSEEDFNNKFPDSCGSYNTVKTILQNGNELNEAVTLAQLINNEETLDYLFEDIKEKLQSGNNGVIDYEGVCLGWKLNAEINIEGETFDFKNLDEYTQDHLIESWKQGIKQDYEVYESECVQTEDVVEILKYIKENTYSSLNAEAIENHKNELLNNGYTISEYFVAKDACELLDKVRECKNGEEIFMKLMDSGFDIENIAANILEGNVDTIENDGTVNLDKYQDYLDDNDDFAKEADAPSYDDDDER